MNGHYLGEGSLVAERVSRLVALIAVLAIALQGCGSGSQAPGDVEPKLGPVSTVVRYYDFRLPLDSYLMSPEQRATVFRAADTVVKNCVARFGLDYEIPPRKTDEHKDRIIGVIDASEAAQFGYKNPRMLETAEAAQREKESQQTEPRSPELIALLNGDRSWHDGMAVPEGGCYGESRRALAVSTDLDESPIGDNLVLRLRFESSLLAEDDSRLKSAFSRWSACMAKAGYDYRNPWESNDDERFRTSSASSAEILTAQTDIRCRNEFNVNGVWVAVLEVYQYRSIDQNEEALRENQKAATEIVAKAEDINAGS